MNKVWNECIPTLTYSKINNNNIQYKNINPIHNNDRRQSRLHNKWTTRDKNSDIWNKQDAVVCPAADEVWGESIGFGFGATRGVTLAIQSLMISSRISSPIGPSFSIWWWKSLTLNLSPMKWNDGEVSIIRRVVWCQSSISLSEGTSFV